MKTFNVRFRKTYEVTHEVQVDAKNEESAIKKARKLALELGPEDEMSMSYAEDDGGDDFIAWESK